MDVNEFNFFRTTMPDTRKADFHLGCPDACLFVDINKSMDGLISLRRISFDGYGCYEINDDTNYLTRDLSAEFLKQMDKQKMDESVIASIVKRLVNINKEHMWSEALNEYNFIENN